MTYYFNVQAIDEPFDLGEVDESGRVQYSANLICVKRPSATFLAEMVGVLVSAGLGVDGVTIFTSSKAEIPTTGTVLQLEATAGVGPTGTHQDPHGTRRAGLRLHVRGATDAEGYSLALAAQMALVKILNQEVAA